MHFFGPMTALVLFISLFNNGTVKGNNLEIQVSQMLQEMIHIKEHFEFLQKDILNNIDLIKLNSMIQGLAEEKVMRVNLGKRIDSIENRLLAKINSNQETSGTTCDKKVSKIEQKFEEIIRNIETSIENKFIAKINCSEVTFHTKLEEKVNMIEQKFKESIENSEKLIEKRLITRMNDSEESFGTKLEEKVNTTEQWCTESIKTIEKHIENRLIAKINGTEVTFGSMLEEKVSTIEKKLKESIANSENLTEKKLNEKMNAREETFGTMLEDKFNKIEQAFKEDVTNTEKDIKNRLIAKINATEVTFGSKLEEKVSTIEKNFKESIENSEKLLEKKLSTRMNDSEKTFGTKLEEKVNTMEKTIKESIENSENFTEKRLNEKFNASEEIFGTKLEEKVSTIELKFKEIMGKSEKLIEKRLVARMNDSEVTFGTKLEEKVKTTEQKCKESIKNIEQHIEHRLTAKINASEVTFGSKLEEKVSTIEKNFKERIEKSEQFTENRLIARINASEVTFAIKLQENVGTLEQKFTQNLGNSEKLTENRLSARINASEVTFGLKLQETISMLEQKVTKTIGNSEMLTENRLIARINASISNLNQTFEKINQWHVEKQDINIRLVGERFVNEGRVEILHKQKWGTVCHDEWDDADATVICRMLGYRFGHAIGLAAYNQGIGPIWLDNVNCNGNETDLADCLHEGWGRHDCGHHKDAGVICGHLPDVGVRLVGGRFVNEGRVEMLHEGQWGTVCDDGWDDTDATVVCRMLGIRSGHAIGIAAYDQGIGPVWLDKVNCNGNETDLADCLHKGWGSHDCGHYKDAGVICGHLPDVGVRLVGGRFVNEGRVEMLHKGQWGTVCDDGWDVTDATVVCRMLGISGPGRAVGRALYGEGAGPIWMVNVNCKGNETTLVDCFSGVWGHSYCSHSEDAGVICGQLADINVRLVQGRSQSEGRVEIFFLGRWGTVCHNGWDNADANVVCRMLGLSGHGIALGNALYGKGAGPIWMDNVNCKGNETTLVDCFSDAWGISHCSHSEDAGVFCGHQADVNVRLVQGRSQSEGRVEISFLGRWGTVCHRGWDNADANVVCRMLGLSGPGRAVRGALHGEGSGRIWMDKVNCKGNETTLVDCFSGVWGHSDCTHSEDAGVFCGQLADVNVRLVQGSSQSNGRVEIFFLGRWGTVCDDEWDNADANVVCRMLGLSGPGRALRGALHGEGAGPIWMDNVNCKGNETTLVDCFSGVWGLSDCSHSEDAGVICGQLAGFPAGRGNL